MRNFCAIANLRLQAYIYYVNSHSHSNVSHAVRRFKLSKTRVHTSCLFILQALIPETQTTPQ